MSEINRSFWIAVASANHVARGRAGGYMQVCHGKEGPLKRLRRGDGVVYYSPTETFGADDVCQAFTAIGTVNDNAPYRFDMGGGFLPFRRNVDWAAASRARIRPLLVHLDFTRGRANWGQPFRVGLFRISAADHAAISEAMGLRSDRASGLFAA